MITKNFIKQCEKAEEIQKLWEQTVGDLFIYEKDIKSGCYFYITEHRKYKNAIYLPTQEQLQEMMITKETKWYKVLSNFFRYINEQCYPSVEDFDNKDYSITYLWLAFVMYEKYKKIWTGKDWKSIEPTINPNQKA